MFRYTHKNQLSLDYPVYINNTHPNCPMGLDHSCVSLDRKIRALHLNLHTQLQDDEECCVGQLYQGRDRSIIDG